MNENRENEEKVRRLSTVQLRLDDPDKKILMDILKEIQKANETLKQILNK